MSNLRKWGKTQYAHDPTRLPNLRVIQKTLKNENADTAKSLQDQQRDLFSFKRQLVEDIKRNYVLEGQLTEIDSKIGLFVHNRISIQEVIAQSHGAVQGGSIKPTTAKESPVSDEQRSLYQNLFYLLQTQPGYLGTIPMVLKMDQVQPFIQTVAFTVFGDQYSEREEYLLLCVFQMALQEEFNESKTIGSLLRGNSAVTKMIREYTKREQGKLYLENVIAPKLEKFVRVEDLNLELNPLKVQAWIINQDESKMGVKSEMVKSATEAEAAAEPRVQAEIAPRAALLMQYSEEMLRAIFDSLDQLPYGIRWIAKQIAHMFRQKFPECSRYEVATMIGGFVYLRYINPAIVTPDADSYKLVTKGLTTLSRRNLVLMAKTLQNLSNFVVFGEKEQYMTPMNPFIEAHKEDLCRFFEELINVREPDEHLMVDRNFVDVGMHNDPVIKIQLNELFFLHSLLVTHIDVVAAEAGDPLRIVLEELGAVPAKVDKDKNTEVVLTLKKSNKTVDALVEKEASEVTQLYNDTKALVMNILTLLDVHSLPFAVQHNLATVLDAARLFAMENKNETVRGLVATVTANIDVLRENGYVPPDRPSIRLLQDIEDDVRNRARLQEYLAKETANINRTRERVTRQHEYLLGQLDSYTQYLENVKKQQGAGEGSSEGKKKKKNQEAKAKTEKISHDRLVKDGVIVESRLLESQRKKAIMAFTVAEGGSVDVTAIWNGFVVDSYQFELDELLERQYNNETVIELEWVVLNLNLLIFLINSIYAKAK